MLDWVPVSSGWRAFAEMTPLSRWKVDIWPSLSSLNQVFNSLLHSAFAQLYPASLCQHGGADADAAEAMLTGAEQCFQSWFHLLLMSFNSSAVGDKILLHLASRVAKYKIKCEYIIKR